jgi:hypothetical protein
MPRTRRLETSKVVDFARYRAAREQLRLPFSGAALGPTAQPVSALTARQAAHRLQMLSHLRQTIGGRSTSR